MKSIFDFLFLFSVSLKPSPTPTLVKKIQAVTFQAVLDAYFAERSTDDLESPAKLFDNSVLIALAVDLESVMFQAMRLIL
jgi:hypothetical protein